MSFSYIGTSELTYLLLGGTAGVTTGTVLATENGGRSLPTAVNFPFYTNVTTSAFVSCFKQSQSLHTVIHVHTYVHIWLFAFTHHRLVLMD